MGRRSRARLSLTVTQDGCRSFKAEWIEPDSGLRASTGQQTYHSCRGV
jgi:hypothetical protein